MRMQLTPSFDVPDNLPAKVWLCRHASREWENTECFLVTRHKRRIDRPICFVNFGPCIFTGKVTLTRRRALTIARQYAECPAAGRLCWGVYVVDGRFKDDDGGWFPWQQDLICRNRFGDAALYLPGRRAVVYLNEQQQPAA